MRKLIKWTPKDVSHLYWLSLWGLKPKEVKELASPLMPERTTLSIDAMTTEVRKFIAVAKGEKITIPPSQNTKVLVRAASKIPAVKEIADLAPIDLTKVEFKTPRDNNQVGRTKKSSERNFEQLKDGEQNEHGGHYNKKEEKPMSVQVKELAQKGEQLGLFEQPISKLKAIKSSEFDNLERVLNIAKEHGAKKVEWNGYTIKF